MLLIDGSLPKFLHNMYFPKRQTASVYFFGKTYITWPSQRLFALKYRLMDACEICSLRTGEGPTSIFQIQCRCHLPPTRFILEKVRGQILLPTRNILLPLLATSSEGLSYRLWVDLAVLVHCQERCCGVFSAYYEALLLIENKWLSSLCAIQFASRCN